MPILGFIVRLIASLSVSLIMSLIISSAAFAKLSEGPASSQNKETVTVAARSANDFIDLVCQAQIEGNLGSINEKVRNGTITNTRALKALLKRLEIPFGPGCVIDSLGSLNNEMKKKGITDKEKELAKILGMSDVATRMEYLKKEYPALSHDQVRKAAGYIDALNLSLVSVIKTGEVKKPVGVSEE